MRHIIEFKKVMDETSGIDGSIHYTNKQNFSFCLKKDRILFHPDLDELFKLVTEEIKINRIIHDRLMAFRTGKKFRYDPK